MEQLPPKYLSIKQASEIYGLSVQTLRNYIAKGKLKVKRIDSRIIRIEISELENLFTDYRGGEFGIWSTHS
jgi:predicted site-specific integrase-resolvase